ncbi:hypothetical protein E2542_SST26224 [Spatholobus suberectus]|nr:hypothetical protein E2542_SST26224 [Spatholobus suberectus]
MRNVSKNRFLTCFRPVVDIDAMLESRAVVDHDRSSSRRFACIPVADKHDTKNSTSKATFSDQELTQNWVVPHPPKRKFSKVIRAVVFETVLNTRVRNGYGQSCYGSKRGYSAYAESSSAGDEKQALVVTNFQEIKAPEWSSSISSSNSPVSESKNISKSESTKDQLEKQKFHCVGIYWILISLAVTVFWGKINVIILTSLLSCFFSLWNASCCWAKRVPSLRNAKSRVYKRDRSGRSGRNKERS